MRPNEIRIHAARSSKECPINGYVSELVTAEDLEPKPSAEEARVLELLERGESYSAVSREVYGSKGGKQIALIKAIEAKYS